MTATIRVCVVDDHSGVRAGIIRLLKGAKNILVVGEAANGAEAIALARSKKPDLLLLDVELPDLRGDVVMRMIRENRPEIKVLSVSSYSDREHVRAMVENTVDGYITKDEAPTMLLEAISSIAAGQKWVSPKASRSTRQIRITEQNLTEKERTILEQILLDRSEKEIAASLGLKEQQVARHVQFLMKKFDVESVAALKQVSSSLSIGPRVVESKRGEKHPNQDGRNPH